MSHYLKVTSKNKKELIWEEVGKSRSKSHNHPGGFQGVEELISVLQFLKKLLKKKLIRLGWKFN
jgi:hypothetical protein